MQRHAMTYSTAILGASGYTGAELVRLIATHPGLQVTALSADRKAGLAMGDVFPFLRPLILPDLVKIDEIDFSNIDICFCARPHATSQAVIKALPRDLKVVDLSADFRLRDVADYEKWYGTPHLALRRIAFLGPQRAQQCVGQQWRVQPRLLRRNHHPSGRLVPTGWFAIRRVMPRLED